MSVLIKMEMPKSCDNCRFSGFGGIKNELVVCMFTGHNAHKNTVDYLDNCPLIFVPTPHGRLIDADDMASITIDCDARGNWKRINAPTIIESEGE